MIACPARATGRAFLPSQAWYVDFKPSGLGRDDSDGPSGPGVLQASDIICRAETILVVAMFARRSYCALNSLGVVDQSPWARLFRPAVRWAGGTFQSSIGCRPDRAGGFDACSRGHVGMRSAVLVRERRMSMRKFLIAGVSCLALGLVGTAGVTSLSLGLSGKAFAAAGGGGGGGSAGQGGAGSNSAGQGGAGRATGATGLSPSTGVAGGNTSGDLGSTTGAGASGS